MEEGEAENEVGAPRGTSKIKGRVVIHKQLVSGGCCCGDPVCPITGHGRVKKSPVALPMDVNMEIASPADPNNALAAQMEAFVASMSKKLDQKFEGLAKASDFENMMVKVDSQAADITRLQISIQELKSTNRQERHDLREELKRYTNDAIAGKDRGRETVKEPMEEVEDCFEDMVPIEEIVPPAGNPRFKQTGVKFNTFDHRRRPRFQASARSEEQERARIEKYEKARRSIKIWPIPGESREEIETNLADFLRRGLGIEESKIAELGIERVERTGLPDNDIVHNELRVVLTSASARDFIYSLGPKLAKHVDADRRPTAGFRVEVPDYLGGEWKLLDDLGYHLKREHGPGTKKYIKYDDYNYSLYLEVRLPGATNWTRITPESANQLKKKRDREDLARLVGRPRDTGLTNGVREPTTSANSVPLGRRKIPDRNQTEEDGWEPQKRRNT